MAGKSLFDLFDYLSSNILMPLGGLLITLFVAYFVKKNELVREMTNNGHLKTAGLVTLLQFVLKFVTPLLLIIVFLNALGILQL